MLLDAAIVAFSFFILRFCCGQTEQWKLPGGRITVSFWYENLPWIVAVYIASFLFSGLYSVLWKYAGERDLMRLAGTVAVPTVVVYCVNRLCIHGVLFNSANCMAAVLIFLLVGGSRLAWRLFFEPSAGRAARRCQQGPQPPGDDRGCRRGRCMGHQRVQTNKEYGHAVVAVDDDPTKLNQTIHGCR